MYNVLLQNGNKKFHAGVLRNVHVYEYMMSTTASEIAKNEVIKDQLYRLGCYQRDGKKKI